MAAAGVTSRRLLKIFVVLLFAGVALRGLSALLLGMHVSGADPHTWSSLTPLRHPDGLVASTGGVIKGWQSYAQVETPGVANAWDVVQWGMAVDILLFAPMYALGLFLFIRHARGTSNPLAVHLGLAATGVAFVADELENVLTLTVVGLGWHGRDGSNWFTAATWGLWTFSWLKWIAATIAVIVAGLLAVPLVRSALSSWRANAKRMHVLRLHFVLVAFAAVIFFTHEQIPDLVRRWTPVTLAVTTALALGFALLIWAATRRLLTVALWSPPTRKDPKERALELKIVRVLVIVAFVQVGLHVLFHGEWDPGWGLAVPAALLGVVALAGLVVDADDPTVRNSEALVTGREPRLPRMLASCLAIAFALGVFDASFGYAVYVHSLAWQALIIPVGAGLGIAVRWIVKRYDLLAWGTAGGLAGAIVLVIVRGGQLQPPPMCTTWM